MPTRWLVSGRIEMGEKAMDTLLAIKKGEKVPDVIHTGLDLVTKDNVNTFMKEGERAVDAGARAAGGRPRRDDETGVRRADAGPPNAGLVAAPFSLSV